MLNNTWYMRVAETRALNWPLIMWHSELLAKAHSGRPPPSSASKLWLISISSFSTLSNPIHYQLSLENTSTSLISMLWSPQIYVILCQNRNCKAALHVSITRGEDRSSVMVTTIAILDSYGIHVIITERKALLKLYKRWIPIRLGLC